MTDPKYICPFEILEIIYVMATRKLSQENNNYVRLDLAIKDTCTECLRDVLHNCVPARFQDINHALQFLEPLLRQHLILYKYSQLFSNSQLLANFSVSECDMSLVYSLIRNSNWVTPPTGGWGKSFTNSPQDRTLGANVERLHLFRNILEHCKEPSISDQDFNNYWSEVRKCVAEIETSLGSTKHQQSLDSLRINDLDPDHAIRIINKFNDAVRDLQAEQCRLRDCLLEIRVNQSGHGSTLSDMTNNLNEQSKVLSDLKTEESNQSNLLRELAVKSEQQNQLLQNDRKVFSDIKTSHNHLDLSIGEALDALKDKDTGLVRIANEQNNQACSLQSIEQKLEEMHKNQTLLLNNNNASLKKIQEIVDRTGNGTLSSLDMDVGSCKQTICGAYHTSINDSCSSVDKNACEEEQMKPHSFIANGPFLPEGQNGAICVTKGYAYIKSELSWKDGVAIANHLLANRHINNNQHEMLTDPTLPRRHIVDGLLKRAILGKSNELKSFFEALKFVSPDTAKMVAGKEVTLDDISMFKKATECAKGLHTDSLRSTSKSCISDLDIRYFRYNLSGFPDIVDSINDAMLSRFHFNATDHLNVIECETHEKRINHLFKLMKLCDVDAELELKAVLEPNLYSEWIEYRTTEGSSDVWDSLRLWLNEGMIKVRGLFQHLGIGFLKALRGSIIFKFKIESGFTIDSLTPESIQQQIEDLLCIGSAASNVKIKSHAHVTVFIMSPDDGGQEEIHFYINFNARGNMLDYTAEITNYEKRLMSEELHPKEIMQWMAGQTSLRKTTIHMLEETISNSDRSRKATMEALLDNIFDLENGRELLEMFCKESSPYVYKEVFSKSSHPSSANTGYTQETALPYQRKGGLQKLFSLQIKIAAPESKGIAEGPDAFICLTKQYVFIKSNLLKKDADEISECLLKEKFITKDEHEKIADLKRKPGVDTLMNKIILGDTDQMKTFFRALKSVNLKVFSVLEATKVTDEDRSRFKQVKESAHQVTNARSGSDSESILDDSDILFFQNCLSASLEVVHSINDAMLARFNFSIRDHSNVLECKSSDLKLRTLCETMNLCDMDVENELKSLLRASLYEEWMQFRKRKGNHDRRQYLRWLNAPVTLVRFMFQPLHFNKAVNGIILKFLTADGFDIASLTREFVQENVTDLLWKGYLETQINIKNPVHVMVFIISPSKNDKDEIHFYIDFDATDDRKRLEEYKQTIADQERLILLEQLDLIELTEWIMNQPDMEKITKNMLEDKLSSRDMSKKEELNILVDSIYEINNGRKLIERFCKENEPDVYNNVFLRTDQDSSEMHKNLVQMPLQYEKGGGRQRLYSFWMDIITDQKDTHISKLHSQRSEFMESKVWKSRYRHTSIVLQAGKLDDIWSDAMVIIGKDRSALDLPRTIIEKVGSQIQREFQDKYPCGLREEEVAVLSGFNLPVWRIFYCVYRWNAIRSCLKMAVKLKMRSIVVLVHEGPFLGSLRHHFMEIKYHFVPNAVTTIYLHADQDAFGWEYLREIAEEELLYRDYFKLFSTDDTDLTANPEPKVFSAGHMTVTIKVGKLEEIKSDALVVLEVAKEQWPTQNLPSEILRKTDPMIQKEFKEKFPAGLEYAEVAVLNGYNLPCRKILYGVLPRWPGAWLEKVIASFLTECFKLASNEGIASIAFVIPSVPLHIAETYASVLYSCIENRMYDKPFLIVIKDGCTGANMLKKVFEEKCIGRIGYVTEDIYSEKILTYSKLPEKSKEGSTYVPHEEVDQLPQRPYESSK